MSDLVLYNLDRMLSSKDQPLLAGPGAVSHEDMKSVAGDLYDDFDARRRQQEALEALEADAEDLKAIEGLEKDLKRKGGGK